MTQLFEILSFQKVSGRKQLMCISEDKATAVYWLTCTIRGFVISYAFTATMTMFTFLLLLPVPAPPYGSFLSRINVATKHQLLYVSVKVLLLEMEPN